MKKIAANQKGVTIIETVAATAIIALLLLTVLGALLFGQGVIVGNDEKNNASASAQEILDTLMVSLSNNATYTGVLVSGATNLSDNTDDFDYTDDFLYPVDNGYTSQQYGIVPVHKSDVFESDEILVGEENDVVAYQIYVRVYYNQGQSYVDLTAFNKKGGVWQ
ncbi:hypothetical protein Q5O14_01350 [Eubacteriaceae bacterium ES2]|nr:hypothetical protein Q5O14_01350 [Eubacteriaceae bacterium ES2]